MARSEEQERADAFASFEAALKLPVEERIARGCLYTFKPVLDEGPGIRMWDTMEDYRRWCEENLPDWLGYRRVTDEEWRKMVEEGASE